MQDIRLALLDKLYAAALDSRLWDAALTDVSRSVGGFGAVLLSFDRDAPTHLSTSTLHDANAAYVQQGWYRHDILRKRGEEVGKAIGLSNRVFTDRLLTTEDIRRRDPFLNEFWRSNQIGGMASYALAMPDDNIFTLAIQQEAGARYFSQEQLDLLQFIGPHAQRAIGLAVKVARAEAKAADASAWIERINAACILVDSGQRVTAINSKALALLGDGLNVSRGKVCANWPGDQARLDRLLGDAIDQPDGRGGCVTLMRNDGSQVILQAFPVPRSETTDAVAALRGKGSAMLIITPQTASVGDAAGAALRCMGLTKAEVAVALTIGAGANPAEAAERLALSVLTIRTHMKTIYSKLGIRRQAELASLIVRLSIAA